MANLLTDYLFSSSPGWLITSTYDEVARDGSSATFDVTVKLKVNGSSSSFYGYAATWKATINGVTNGTSQFKGTERWYGSDSYRTFTTRIKVTGLGGGGGTLPINITIAPSGGGNISLNWNGSVSYSVWNTAPYWGGGSAATTNPSGTIAENTSSITVSWSAASDNEGNTRYYDVYRHVNGDSGTIVKGGTSSTSFVDNISGFGQGTRIQYSVKCSDGSLWASTTLWSNTVTKNTFTRATLNLNGNSIAYGSTALTFPISGAANTNGNGSFTYSLGISGITVYNPTVISGASFNLTIYKSGTLPTTPYVKFSDLQTYFKNSGYVGNLSVTLTTTNAYGSSGTSTVTLPVDIRTNPSAFAVQTIRNTVTVGASAYFIPKYKDVEILWSPSIDAHGGTVTYDVYGKKVGGSYVILRSGVVGESAIVTISDITAQTSYQIKVVAKTTYNYQTYDESDVITLHYYEPPLIQFDPVVRIQTGATISGTITPRTSIPGVSLTAAAYTGKGSGALTVTNGVFSVTETLLEEDAYTFAATIQDNVGSVLLLGSVSNSVKIARYKPMLSIRELGVGINAVASGSEKLVVGGNVKVEGVDPSICIKPSSETEGKQGKILFTNTAADQGVKIRYNAYDSTQAPFGIHIEKDETNTQTTNKAYLKVEGDIYADGGNKVYHEGYKPTASNIGAIPLSQRIPSGANLNNYATEGMYYCPVNVDAATISNIPSAQAFSLLVEKHAGFKQTFSVYSITDNRSWYRNYYGGTWSGWKEIITSDKFSTGSNYLNQVASINGDGVMEIGKYIDFHDGGTADYNVRLNAVGNMLTNTGGFDSSGAVWTSDWYYVRGNKGIYFNDWGGGWYMTDSTWIRAYNDKNIYTPNTMKCGTMESRWIKGTPGTNLDIACDNTASIYFNVNATSGCAVYLNDYWSGASGTEPSFYNTKGNGWGFLGNTSNSWFRVYGTGGSVSDRAKKYDISKADTETLYDNVKDLNVYNYRSISSTIDEETGETTEQVFRQDLMLGCMVDELPTECVFYDNEGGDGKAVDNYSYTTMILGATKHLQQLVEQQQIVIDQLLQRIETLEGGI